MSDVEFYNPPKLDELLREPTVFILGAGSSKPYGFPLWEDLKPEFLDLCETLKGKYSPAGIDYWKQRLTELEGSPGEPTIDELAQDALTYLKTPEDRDAARWIFQVFVSIIIVRHERNDLGVLDKQDWIELFAKKLHKILENDKPEAILPNLQFINFNYDRCFASRFGASFVKPLYNSFPATWERQTQWPRFGTRFFTHIHPHGAISPLSFSPESDSYCTLSNRTPVHADSPRLVLYGDEGILPEIIDRYGLQIAPVDSIGPTTWTMPCAYNQIKGIVDGASNIVIIGLSEDGWRQNHIDKCTLDGKRVFSTGKTRLAAKIFPTGEYALGMIKKM